MRQYQVPQFIDVEDKIFFERLTLKQFVFIAAGGGVVLISFYILPFILFILVALLTAPVAFALAFLKVNQIPFTKIVLSAMSFLSKPRLYLWKQLPPEKNPEKDSMAKSAEPEGIVSQVPKLSESRLQDLAWSLDIKDKLQD